MQLWKMNVFPIRQLEIECIDVMMSSLQEDEICRPLHRRGCERGHCVWSGCCETFVCFYCNVWTQLVHSLLLLPVLY